MQGGDRGAHHSPAPAARALQQNKEHDEAIAVWEAHNKQFDDRNAELLKLVETKIAQNPQQLLLAQQQQQQQQDSAAGNQTLTTAPSDTVNAGAPELPSAASGATVGLAQQFAQGGDPAAVAAIQLFERRVHIEPNQLVAVSTMNPSSEGKAELSKLWAWVNAHEATTMLNPQQLIYTYQHMDVAPIMVQELVGYAVWKTIYGEAKEETSTIVPEQLKQIITHQLKVLADEIDGNELEPVRTKADKRAMTQGEELVKHTQDLERAARRTAMAPY